MRVTLNTNALYHIYAGVSSTYTAYQTTGESSISFAMPRSIQILKENIAHLIDMDEVIYRTSLTPINSPFISSFSKDAKDVLNVDFNMMGLLLVRKCLQNKIEILWQNADEYQHDKRKLNEVFEDMADTESLLVLLDQYMEPLHN